MELTHSQISEFLSNYTSSSEGFVALQSLIMNSLMFHERELFVSENAHEQCNGFRPRRWYSHGFEFSLRIPRSRSGNFYPVFLGVDTQRKRGACQAVQPSLYQGTHHGTDRRDF